MFSYIDKDGDGKISFDEHMVYSREYTKWMIEQTPEGEARDAARARIE